MREILFRGKRLDNGEWVYGDIKHGNYFNGDKTIYIVNTTGAYTSNYPVDPATVGQYTGLKDVNDKMIFEGDILYIDDNEEHPVPVYVEFKYSAWSAVSKWHPFYRHTLTSRYVVYEIVGNIHDNPEQLEGE